MKKKALVALGRLRLLPAMLMGWLLYLPAAAQDGPRNLDEWLGDQGQIRQTGSTIGNFLLWAAIFAGVIMMLTGLWKAIGEMKKPQQQPREWGAPLALMIGGSALASFVIIYQLIAGSITGTGIDDPFALPSGSE